MGKRLRCQILSKGLLQKKNKNRRYIKHDFSLEFNVNQRSADRFLIKVKIEYKKTLIIL